MPRKKGMKIVKFLKRIGKEIKAFITDENGGNITGNSL
jgi:hypothetical protein